MCNYSSTNRAPISKKGLQRNFDTGPRQRDTCEIQVEKQKYTIQREEYRHLLEMMIPAYKKKGCAAFHSRQESMTSFPEENTTMTYSGFEPESTRLQDEGHIRYTGWILL
ncbi:hypothetical protein TNCV_1227041 [Trichonephila clavipes]|nr:hypothetical protein TNCV_1227041 [Trichonephila clavipes]